MRIEASSVVALLLLVDLSSAFAVVPSTEDFPVDSANWRDSTGLPGSGALAFNAAGGPDGGSYASGTFAFADPNSAGDTVVLFRGQDEYGSSGGVFEGNWAADGIRKVTAQVRHDAPVPLNFFFRASGPFNFPGGVAVDFVPVLPNQWTEIDFTLNPGSPQFVSFEGMTWASIFNNVGHTQFGVSIPAALAGNPTTYTFDIDKISVNVPEPTTVSLAGLSMIGLLGFRRRRK